MLMYVAYVNARDHPDHKYVVRRWTVTASAKGVLLTPDAGLWGTAKDETELATIRERLASAGVACIGRFEDDDPAILEVWI